MALTAAQIVTLACQDAKVPGFTQQAGASLNILLQDLCQNYDFDVSRTVVTIPLTGKFGPFVLPADYLRATQNGVFYTVNQTPYFMVSIDLWEFDALPKQSGVDGYPEVFATDMSLSPPQLWVWPGAGGAFPLTVRYQRQMPDIAAPETSATVPWFPNSNYLRTRLAAELMKITDDTRIDATFGRADDIMRHYQQMQGDTNNRVRTVDLDRRRFGKGSHQLPNTKLIGWAFVLAMVMPTLSMLVR